ncbi:MAG: helicase C-terminal domain-containing protein [Cyanobacteria bacterium P01_G01_bin.54]
MLEAQVHSSLLTFLRTQPPALSQPAWPHHLTLARLVARALRLQRSALIQTAAMPTTYGMSYLTALLLWSHDGVVVVPETQQTRFLDEFQRLQGHLKTHKQVQRIGAQLGDWVKGKGADDASVSHCSSPRSQVANGRTHPPTLLLTSPAVWLSDRLGAQHQFPPGLPTLIDGVDDLEAWARAALTRTLLPSDWQELAQALPEDAQQIIQIARQLGQAFCDRPRNPYDCYPLEPEQQAAIDQLSQDLKHHLNPLLPPRWQTFLQQWHQPIGQLRWATVEGSAERIAPAASPTAGVRFHVAPMQLAPQLASLWQQQPTVFMGRFLGLERQDGRFWRDRLGLGDVTTVKFAPQRQPELIQLYVPERLAFPNHPAFRDQLLNQILRLCRGGMLGQRHGRQHPPEWISPLKRPVVLVVEDTPLRTQVSTTLAAEFGSCVQLETPALTPKSILVCGWDFWQFQQDHLPPPQLLIIATLPLPSMENPLVAAQVQQLKRQRQDWFQGYLLPIALQRLQRAVLPVRDRQGVVALLDNRVNHRSYGRAIFTALEPYARINYIDFVA